MDEQAFRAQLAQQGYGEAEFKDVASNLDGELHTHDTSVMLMVMDGEFTVVREDGATTFNPGDVCQVPAGTRHFERTGSDGARVLIGRK